MAALYSSNTEQPMRLFERIQGKSCGSSLHSRMDALISSIKQHLNAVLNTRPQTCQSSKALGVIDLNDATATAIDFRASLEEAIKKCILDYEPRISNVTVSSIINESALLELNFLITASVKLEQQCQSIEFNMQMDSQHRYKLDRF